MCNSVDFQQRHRQPGGQSPNNLDKQLACLHNDCRLGQVIRFALVVNVFAVHTREMTTLSKQRYSSSSKSQSLRRLTFTVPPRIDGIEAVKLERKSTSASKKAVCHGPLIPSCRRAIATFD